MEYYESILKMDKTIDKIKELINKNVTAMDVIDEPEVAFVVKYGLELMENYIRIEKEKHEFLEEMNRKLEKIDNVSKEIEQLREEIKRRN